jgi:hypothetical protein
MYGAAFGLSSLTNLQFRSDRPFVGCKICGIVFQSEADRDPVGVFNKQRADFNFNHRNVQLFALGLRKEWSRKHAKLHTEAEHESLAKSGLWATPEAAAVLAAYGIFSMTDIVVSDEIEDALKGASAIPFNDSEDK